MNKQKQKLPSKDREIQFPELRETVIIHHYSLFPELDEPERLLPKGKKVPNDNRSNFGLELCKGAFFSGKYGIPLLKPYTGPIPEQFIPFHDLYRSREFKSGVLCFEYDYILDRIWNNPFKYYPTMSKYQCVCEPDFSLKIGNPPCLQIANCYRKHALAFSMQDNGIDVLPSPSWSDIPSLEYCFDGYPKGGAVIISTVGTLRDERSRFYFERGFNAMLSTISPDVVLIYGDVDDRIKSLMPYQLDVRYYENPNFSRMRYYGRQRSI